MHRLRPPADRDVVLRLPAHGGPDAAARELHVQDVHGALQHGAQRKDRGLGVLPLGKIEEGLDDVPHPLDFLVEHPQKLLPLGDR